MLLKGSEVSKKINDRIRDRVEALCEKGCHPTIGIVRVGERPDDLSYERSVIRRCAALGIQVQTFPLPETARTEDVVRRIDYINTEADIHGALIFSPMPRHMDETRIRSALRPEKDLDGICPQSQYGIFAGLDIGYPPCTPDACIKILEHYGISCEGKKIAVVGRSMIVGRPLAMMLLHRNATVTICHTRTSDMEKTCREADIVIAAAGRPRLLTGEYFREGQIVLDVGIHPDGSDGFCGDVDFAAASEIVEAITPVPGGVGTVTTAVLLWHLVCAAEKSLSARNEETKSE